MIVDNKPGAGQMVAINAVKSAPPDGYTLYLGSGSALSQAPGVRKDLGYDPLKDFSLIALVATVPGVIVSQSESPGPVGARPRDVLAGASGASSTTGHPGSARQATCRPSI